MSARHISNFTPAYFLQLAEDARRRRAAEREAIFRPVTDPALAFEVAQRCLAGLPGRGPRGRFLQNLWDFLESRGFIALDFRLRGGVWEAELSRGRGWHRISDILDGRADA